MNSIILKYLISNFFRIIFNMILIFMSLSIILTLFEEIEFFKNLEVGFAMPFKLTLLFIPNLVFSKLFPFIIFASSMWYLISIKTNKDLLSLKVFGYSNLKIVSILSTSAFVFGLIVIFAINPITSTMIKYYEKTKAEYSTDVDHLVSINKNGVWIKESVLDETIITKAKKLEDNFLNEVTIYKFNKINEMIERIEAKKVDISKNLWVAETVVVYDLGEDNLVQKKNIHMLRSNYDISKLGSLYKNLDTVSFYTLISEYESLLQKGYNKDLLNEKLNIFFSLPIFLFLMVVLASIFTVGSVNKPQNLYYIFISIISCVVIYYFKDLSIALGQTNRISLSLSVWMPILAISLFCSIGVLQINEK